MLYVLTGEGKGKTTSALGTAIRAIGYGYPVIIVQFMKNWDQSGEMKYLQSRGIEIEFYRFGREDRKFVNPKAPRENDFEIAKEALKNAKKLLAKRPYLMILDEVNVALKFGLLDLNEVLDFLSEVPTETHLIFTGRGAHPEIIERADLVTEMKEIKHPYQKGIKAQKGLDY
jgi:cob(I)alamin adenosyltransferase